MPNDIADLRDTIVPKSDQINSEQLLAGPITITITSVERGNDEQPLVLHYDGENGRPYKPGKSMRKVLIFAWGADGSQWVGKSMTLFCDPTVKYGGVAVGGIRISHLSDIERELSISLTATRGKKTPFIIRRLEAKPDPVAQARAALTAAAEQGTDALLAAWGKVPAPVKKSLGGCPADLKTRAAAVDAAATPAPASEPAPAEPEGDVF